MHTQAFKVGMRAPDDVSAFARKSSKAWRRRQEQVNGLSFLENTRGLSPQRMRFALQENVSATPSEFLLSVS